MFARLRRIGILAAMLGLATLPAAAADIEGRATATIQRSVTLVEDSELNFGNIAVDGTAGTVVMDAGGNVSGPAGFAFGGNATAGRFTVMGEPNAAVLIVLGGGSLNGPGRPMRFNNLTHDAGPTPTTNAAGRLTFSVGAQLRVNANQNAGTYAGAYRVSVNY